ncbi:ferredoxin-type protein NapF [Vreelandella aquamarina]|uniref:ferredoxin-type protein NapF n=1 Tax=Vreelandella aquamarina TaxID=77097 RepID=UPI00078259B4|nr:ferredoxin-type protein NapF [Halomonas axialensis]
MTRTDSNNNRRNLFRRLSGRDDVRRPPWSRASFLDLCTGCNACIDACPEGILSRGGGGYPELSFAQEGCSLCGDCATVCEPQAIQPAGSISDAFPWHAEVQPHCLALAGIHCQSCQDACEWSAIRFPLKPGGRPPQPDIHLESCTGCGACYSACPNQAISLLTKEKDTAYV